MRVISIPKDYPVYTAGRFLIRNYSKNGKGYLVHLCVDIDIISSLSFYTGI